MIDEQAAAAMTPVLPVPASDRTNGALTPIPCLSDQESATDHVTPVLTMPAPSADAALTPIQEMPAATLALKPEALVPTAGHKDTDTQTDSAGRSTSDPHHVIAGHYTGDPLNAAAGPRDDAPHKLDAGHASTDTQRARATSVESEENGHIPVATQHVAADLDQLHALLGHYARQLWDVQKLRIAQGNRIAAMERDELADTWIAPAHTTMDGLDALEKAIDRQLSGLVKQHPMADWIKGQRGIGLPGFARLLGITGSLDRFATVSKLWAYLGMHVVDGAAPKRKKGERANWSPQGRVLCHLIGESIVKVGKGGPYRAAYDRKKGEYEADRPDWTQARRHNAAMRYAAKSLLKAMWIEWHQSKATAS